MGIAGRVFSVIVPGGGLIRRRRYLLGAGLLLLCVLLFEGYAGLLVVSPSGAPGWLGAALFWLAAGIWALNALAEGLLWASGGEGEREEVYRRALEAFAAGEDERCEKLLASALRRGPLDADFLFLRAQAALKAGRRRRARRLFRKCRDFDEKGKWTGRIESAMKSS